MPEWNEVPISVVTTIPPNAQFVEVYRDRWWLTDNKGNVLFRRLRNSPMCNPSESIVKTLARKWNTGYTFIGLAFLEIDPSDY